MKPTMAQSSGAQLESVLDKVLKSGNVQALDAFLEEAHQGTPMKCSQHFLTKLDKLISGPVSPTNDDDLLKSILSGEMQSLDHKDAKPASLGFATLYKCGKYLKLPGADKGLSSLITKGLIQKWFEKCKQLWIQCGPLWDESLLTLSENFLNALMIVHETCKEGTFRVTESFLYPVGQLAVDPRIYISIQKEAIRKYNLILDKIPMEIKENRKILTSQEASDIMAKLAGCILEGGDYDLQSSLMEALCRMATPDQRKKLAVQWFRMGHVASAFAQISDAEFETACRRFLNMVNGMQGDKRRVHSFPSLEVYLGKYELLMPSDEKLEEFWIDFNLGSRSISFYFSLPEEEEGHWETICINENEVQSYTVADEGKRQVLQIKLSEVVVIGAVEGSSLTIHFSSSLDILKAACNTYGYSKNKLTTVVTAVKTANEGNNIQVVPESQVSIGESEKNTGPYVLSARAASAPMVTPAKMKISESTTFICSRGGELVLSGNCLASQLSSKDEGKPSLEKFCLRDKTVKTSSLLTIPGSTNAVGMKRQKKSVAEKIDMAAAGQREEKSLDPNFVPDTQPRTTQSTSSSRSKLSVSDILMMPTQKVNYLPRSGQQEHCQSSAQKLSVSDSNLVLQKQFHREVTQRLPQVITGRNQDPPPQEPTLLQRKMTNTREDSRDRSLGNLCGSSLCSPKVQQSQKKDHTKEEGKGQMSLEGNAVSTKASAKSTTTKTMQYRIFPKINDGNKPALSRKRKRDAKISGSIVKVFSNETNPRCTEKATAIVQNRLLPLVTRPIFNISWKSAGKKEDSGAMKSHKTTAQPNKQRKDVFAFHTDSPVNIGEKSSVKKALDPPNKALNQSKPVKSASGRPHATGQRPKRNAAIFVKSYREPDTDDSQSEAESAPFLKYSSTDYPENNERAASKQPAKNKSLSEMQATSKNKRVMAGNLLKETSKLNKKNVTSAQEEMSALKDSVVVSQNPLCQSSPFIEKMRTIGRTAPVLDMTHYTVLSPRGSLLPTSPKPICKDPPSPIPLLPKLGSTVGTKGKWKPCSLYSTEKNHSLIRSKLILPPLSSCSVGDQSPEPSPLTQHSETKQHLSSVSQSPLSISTQPLLTSTQLEQNKPQETSPPQPTYPEDTTGHSCTLDINNVSLESLASLSQSPTKSSVHSGEFQDSATAGLMVSLKSEKTPLKDGEFELTQHLISGPFLRRHISMSSNSEEDEMEKKKKSKTRAQHSPQMIPRKLFKSFPEVSPVDELSQVGSSSHMSSSHWETVILDEDLYSLETDVNQNDFCQQLRSELKYKSQMLEIYNKQSSKTVEQHVSSMGMQLTEHRTQKLEQIQKVLLEEIHEMEQDDNTLKSMEKDLNMYWKKQSTAFHSFQKQDIKRNETLGRILQSKACHSQECEDGIISSKMGLIGKDMTSDRHIFINDMMKRELQSVKRGLDTLLSP